MQIFKSLRAGIVILLALTSFRVASFEITDVSPITGPPTTLVTIQGSGFDTAKSYAATIGGRPAVVGNVTATGLEMVVAPGTTSGSIVVSDGVDSPSALAPFVVTRKLTGRLKVPEAVGVEGYQIVGYQSLAAPVKASPTEATFAIEVPLEQPALIWALKSESDAPYLAMITSDDTEAAIDTRSTAMALALINPALGARDDAKARAIKKRIRDKNFDRELVDFLETNARRGLQYVEDARYEATLVSFLREIHKPEVARAAIAGASNVTPMFPQNTLIKPINRELLLSELTTKLTLVEPTPAHPEQYLLQVDVGSRFSSVDWIVEVFPLRRSGVDFPDGLASIHALTFTNTPPFASTTVVAEGLLPARLDTSRVDYIGTLAKFLVSKLEGAVSDPTALKSN